MATMTIKQIEDELEVVYGALHNVTKGLSPEIQLLVQASRLKGMREALETACIMVAPKGEEWTKFRARQLRASRYRVERRG